MSEKYSVSPTAKVPLPKPEDYKSEFETIKKRVSQGGQQAVR